MMNGVRVACCLDLKRLTIFGTEELCRIEREAGNSLELVIGHQAPLDKVIRYSLNIRTHVHAAIICNKVTTIILVEKLLYGMMTRNAAHYSRRHT